MAVDLVYPLAFVVLAGVAATNLASLPYTAGLVIVLLVLNSFRTSMFSTLARKGKELTCFL
jgi:hypothetical protein